MSARSELRFFRHIQREEGVSQPVANIWYLVGEEGASSFAINYMPEELEGLQVVELFGAVQTDAGWYYGSDVGVHDRKERDGWAAMEDCIAFEGDPCWYTGSRWPAQELIRLWSEGGFDDAIIRYALESVYELTFRDG